MDKIEVPEEQVVPIEAIALGLSGLKIAFVNVFGIRHGDGSWTLIDAAIPYSASRIRNWAEKTFGKAPNAIVLTHGHFDHVSAAKELADEWDVPIYAHPFEFPYITGEKEYPPPNWAAGGGIMPCFRPHCRAVRSTSASDCAVCQTIWLSRACPNCLDGSCSILPDTHRAMSVSSANRTAPCSPVTRSAQPSRKVFLRPISFSIRNCTGHQRISLQTGALRITRWKSWPA